MVYVIVWVGCFKFFNIGNWIICFICLIDIKLNIIVMFIYIVIVIIRILFYDFYNRWLKWIEIKK